MDNSLIYQSKYNFAHTIYFKNLKSFIHLHVSRHICHYFNLNILKNWDGTLLCFSFFSSPIFFKKSVDNQGNNDFYMCKEFDVFYCDIKIASDNLYVNLFHNLTSQFAIQ